MLLGAFRTEPWAAAVATSGVIFAAAYLLWALQCIIYQRLDRPENAGLPDLSRRELAILVPIIVAILWIGVYPKPILERIEPSVEHFVTQVQQGPPRADVVRSDDAAARSDAHAD